MPWLDAAAKVKTARSALECRLFIDLNPCGCGGVSAEVKHRMVTRDGRLCALYAGTCNQCQAELEYVFALADEIVPVDQYGGDTPSTIVDAAQFLIASDDAAKRVSMPVHSAEERLRARYSLGRAIACLDEVLKWVPAGAESVPDGAFFTPIGRSMVEREPGRFRRMRLVALRTTYRTLLLGMQ